MSKKNLNAFTLVEILIVIAILAILAVVTFVVINPAARINAANDSQTRNNVIALCDAISLYVVDQGGALPTVSNPSAGTALATVTEATLVSAGDDAADLENIAPDYIASLPTTATGGVVYVGQLANGQVICGGNLSDGSTLFSTIR